MNRTEVKQDGIWGGGAILPGEVLLFWLRLFPGGVIKRTREGETLIGKGAEDDRSACSTEDSGPEKPGNRAEEKTLTIQPRGGDSSVASPDCGKTQTKGRVTTRERRDRVEGERASKPEGEREGRTGHQREVPEVRSDPV